MSSEVEINGVYSNVVVEAHEKNEIQLKEMIESIKDVVTCYVIDRASTRIVDRATGEIRIFKLDQIKKIILEILLKAQG